MHAFLVSMLSMVATTPWITPQAADNPDGVQYGPCYGSIPAEYLADPNDPTYVPGQVSPLEGILPPLRDESSAFVPLEEYDWGMDRLIYSSSGGVGNSQDFDLDPATGYIYAAFDTDHTTGDSIIVFRSTDSGFTWSYWGVCTNTDGALSNAKIRIVTTGGSTWVCVLCMYNEPAGTNDLYLRRWHVDGSAGAWDHVYSDVAFADMDGDIGSSGWLYVTFVPNGSANDVWVARNALGGAGWVNGISLFIDPGTTPYPAISAGAGGVVGVTFIDTRLTTNDEVRVRRSTDYGATWLSSVQVSDNTAGFELENCDIAYSRGIVGWITVTFESGGSGNVGYYWTENGTAWNYGTLLAGTGDEFMPSLRANKNTGVAALAYNSDPGDIVYVSYSLNTNPDDFSTPLQINDQAATGLWGPTPGWITSGTVHAVEYTRISGYALYFDFFNNTGISDGDVSSVTGLGVSPNPFMDVATISFSLDNGGPVSIEIFDMSGRLVTTLAEGSSFASGGHSVTWNGTASGAPVPGGVYICRMTSQGSTQSARMVLAR